MSANRAERDMVYSVGNLVLINKGYSLQTIHVLYSTLETTVNNNEIHIFFREENTNMYINICTFNIKIIYYCVETLMFTKSSCFLHE